MHAPGESAPAMRVQHSRQEYVLKGEDTSCALDMELDDGAIVKFYGVFDGHGGPRAAQYCAANLATFVRDEFAACKGTRAERLKAACSAAFVACDKKFAATNPGFGDGTTASIVIIDGLELTAANVGDSTVMLYTTDGAEPVPLITDHRVKRRTEAEQKRVLAGGATIGRIKGPNGQPIGPERLYPGGLQVSRSIGDSDSTAACIAEPAVMSCTLPPIGGTIVLASDGVWCARDGAWRGAPVRLSLGSPPHAALRSRPSAPPSRPPFAGTSWPRKRSEPSRKPAAPARRASAGYPAPSCEQSISTMCRSMTRPCSASRSWR